MLGKEGEGWPILRRVLDIATAALSAEMVGTAQKALDMSVEYAKTRVQFGKPIGSFQAVKHKCVDMMVAVENARSLTYYACWTVDEHTAEAATAVPMAKAYASDMAKNVTSEAIQVHGGIGFTWEHDMHLFHRRALAGEANLGNAPVHRETRRSLDCSTERLIANAKAPWHRAAALFICDALARAASLRASCSTAVPLKKFGLVAVQNLTGFTNTNSRNCPDSSKPVLHQLVGFLGAFAHVGHVPMADI